MHFYKQTPIPLRLPFPPHGKCRQTPPCVWDLCGHLRVSPCGGSPRTFGARLRETQASITSGFAKTERLGPFSAPHGLVSPGRLAPIHCIICTATLLAVLHHNENPLHVAGVLLEQPCSATICPPPPKRIMKLARRPCFPMSFPALEWRALLCGDGAEVQQILNPWRIAASHVSSMRLGSIAPTSWCVQPSRACTMAPA